MYVIIICGDFTSLMNQHYVTGISQLGGDCQISSTQSSTIPRILRAYTINKNNIMSNDNKGSVKTVVDYVMIWKIPYFTLVPS